MPHKYDDEYIWDDDDYIVEVKNSELNKLRRNWYTLGIVTALGLSFYIYVTFAL